MPSAKRTLDRGWGCGRGRLPFRCSGRTTSSSDTCLFPSSVVRLSCSSRATSRGWGTRTAVRYSTVGELLCGGSGGGETEDRTLLSSSCCGSASSNELNEPFDLAKNVVGGAWSISRSVGTRRLCNRFGFFVNSGGVGLPVTAEQQSTRLNCCNDTLAYL
jgi:hypothetical protein